MDVVTGMDTSASSSGLGGLLVGIRRLMALADSASDGETIFRALAARAARGAGRRGGPRPPPRARGEDEDLVAVYMFDGDGRLSYLLPPGERPPGVSWVASTGRSFLAADARELASSVPRLSATRRDRARALLLPLAERGEVEAVVVLVRRDAERVRRAPSRAGERRSSTRRPPRSRSCGRAPRRAPTR